MLETVADPDFSRVVRVDNIGGKEQKLELRASDSALLGVGARLGLERLNALEAKISLHRHGERGVCVNVDFSADLVQSCVVSLESVASRVTDTFTVICDEETESSDHIDIDPLADDPPEPIIDGKIDVGEFVVQHLSLVIEPYPRASGVAEPGKEGTALDTGLDGEEEGGEPENAFSVLKDFRIVDDPGN